MDYILVLGSVSSKQYQGVCNALRMKGYRQLQVVRIADCPLGSDFIDKIAFTQNWKTDDEFDETIEKLKIEMLEDVDLSRVRAIVQEEPPEYSEYSSEERWLWLKERFERDVPTYVVLIGPNGDFWLEGRGLEEYGLRPASAHH